MAVFLAGAAKAGPLVYWFGGWTPREGVAIGIAFVVDPAGAGCAAFVAALFCASFVFSWGYFDEVHARYHALMLIFLAAMAGFATDRRSLQFFCIFRIDEHRGFCLDRLQARILGARGRAQFHRHQRRRQFSDARWHRPPLWPHRRPQLRAAEPRAVRPCRRRSRDPCLCAVDRGAVHQGRDRARFISGLPTRIPSRRPRCASSFRG